MNSKVMREVSTVGEVAPKKVQKSYLTRFASNRKTAPLFKLQKVWAETI
jgi:hypothetical protein